LDRHSQIDHPVSLVEEIVVDNVRFLRDAETNGTYDHVLTLLSGH
jgi:hypothetical protein